MPESLEPALTLARALSQSATDQRERDDALRIVRWLERDALLRQLHGL
jgi:hypothetical protein